MACYESVVSTVIYVVDRNNTNSNFMFKIVFSHEWNALSEPVSAPLTASRESTCLWKETRSHTRCVPSLLRTRRSRLWMWWSPTSTQAPSTRPGRVRSSAPRPVLQTTGLQKVLGWSLGRRRRKGRGFNLCFQGLRLGTRSEEGGTDEGQHEVDLLWEGGRLNIGSEITLWMYMFECFILKAVGSLFGFNWVLVEGL